MTRTVRDPVWQNIRLDSEAARIVDTPEFQRLRRVKQLGFAHLVFPGAVHTRFLHAIGVYHLTKRALAFLHRGGALDRLDAAETEQIPLVRLAALLHDVGHYAFSHAMEEIGTETIPTHHEEMAAEFLAAEPINTVLRGIDPEAPRVIAGLIRGDSGHPLQGLVAGSLDLDKIDYLRRDSLFCGVPYGAVDVERLLPAMTLEAETPDRRPEVAVTEKGLSALESLLFSKYQMFRNVYWHHGVRAATLAFRRLIETALEGELLESEELAGPTDEELLNLLGHRLAGSPPTPNGPLVERLLSSLVNRRLPKRAIELQGDELPAGLGDWTTARPDLVRRLERQLELEWGLPKGCAMVDHPGYPEMLELRLLLLRRNGAVLRLTSAGEEGLIDLPRLSRSLHHAARVFRVFTLERVEPPAARPILALLEAEAGEVEARLSEARSLY